MIEIREFLAKRFRNGTGARIKRIEGASHMLHWNKPNEVVKEVLYWFK